ncbi:MAG: hypothetical protein JF625_29060 [Inquilinus limosus]|uniref:Uncharacterized protein n=1 Tax=Inquilinus limosus TaxID=171674 RepID=A0A952KKQ9_9PROT|nr:hypothetical protein [Inquilinus limosus]
MVKTVHAASAAALAGLLIAVPAVAQNTVVMPQAPAVVTPAPTVVAPAPPTVIAPAPVVTAPADAYPVDPNTRVDQPVLMQGGVQPYHPPVTAMPSGPAPGDPREYATDGAPITVTGHVDGVTHLGGMTSFRLQTPTEAWTVVVPDGEAGRIGRSATVTGYPHVEIRNQLLARSVSTR